MKKAIVVVSTDVSDYEIVKGNIESVENNIRGRFPDYEVRRAYSAPVVIQSLGQGNGEIQTMQQVIRSLQIEGYQEVICISLI